MTRDLRHLSAPVGPYRDVQTVSIATADYEKNSGFTVAAVAAGSLMVRTLDGTADQAFTVTAGSTLIGPGSIAVLCRAVRMNATVGSILIGII